MIDLEPVIAVRELPPARSRLRQHLMSLRELVRSRLSPDESAILAYLRQGVVCGIYHDPGLLFDVLAPGRRLGSLPSTDSASSSSSLQAGMVLTDGTWVWYGVLPYYVSEYHLQLPERFLRFAEQRAWKIDPASICLEEVDWDALDAVHELRGAVK